MSWQTVKAVKDYSQARGAARMVLMVIAEYCDDTGGGAHPNYDQIATDAGVSTSTVKLCIDALEREGELKVKRSRGRGNAHEYRVTIGPKSADRRPFYAGRKQPKRADNTADGRPFSEAENSRPAPIKQPTGGTQPPVSHQLSNSQPVDAAVVEPPARAREGGDGDGGAGEPRQESASVERSDLFGVKVPLNERERAACSDRIAEVWQLVHQAQHPGGQVEHLYRHTFGLKPDGRGGTTTSSPRGGEYRLLAVLTKRYPLPWLVCAFVVAADAGSQLRHVEAFIQPWLDALRKPVPGVAPALDLGAPQPSATDQPGLSLNEAWHQIQSEGLTNIDEGMTEQVERHFDPVPGHRNRWTRRPAPLRKVAL